MALVQVMGPLVAGPPGPCGLHAETITVKDAFHLQAFLLDFAPQVKKKEETKKWSCLHFKNLLGDYLKQCSY